MKNGSFTLLKIKVLRHCCENTLLCIVYVTWLILFRSLLLCKSIGFPPARLLFYHPPGDNSPVLFLYHNSILLIVPQYLRSGICCVVLKRVLISPLGHGIEDVPGMTPVALLISQMISHAHK